jgi:mannan endo-1,4-beta-mannosidase
MKHQRQRPRRYPFSRKRTAAVLAAATLITIAAVRYFSGGDPRWLPLPVAARSYLGVYLRSAPGSYAAVDKFAKAIGREPNVVSSYSSWLEPFQAKFAEAAARRGAVPIIQINPDHVSLAAIAAGRYDRYLNSYAATIRSYGKPVILGFGHEMNGWWYSWGYSHTPASEFVAAWRHIVDVFHGQGAGNVTWLWTINVIASSSNIRGPGPWWPGSAYVTWVGIDGYYLKRSWTFASLFGPTIKAVRDLTPDPILISETGAAPASDKPAKISDLFTGIREYGLLGIVWFDERGYRDWRLDDSSALTAFRQGARTFHRPRYPRLAGPVSPPSSVAAP